ncbi:Potassium voltage-gated channel subfamily A member 3 [Fasciola hepatica]|uniref:Potassium voltage-gated channel subfamily A member 3 n=1 Tax=Fasciola hepatica TaxID=6192 RepID=A0A2H1CQP4_FASHE|nr:Potassium voltage-gated channel subfamily A member 3 [Fasciola hepatica]
MIYMPSFMKPIKESASETVSCSMLAISTGDLQKQMCSCLRSSESAVDSADTKPIPSDIKHPLYRHSPHRYHKHHQRTRSGPRERSKTVISQLKVNSEVTPLSDTQKNRSHMEKQHSFPGICIAGNEKSRTVPLQAPVSHTLSRSNIQQHRTTSEWLHNKQSHSTNARSTPCLKQAFENRRTEINDQDSESLPNLSRSTEVSEQRCEWQNDKESKFLSVGIKESPDNSKQLHTLTNRLLYFPNISSKLKVQFAGSNCPVETRTRAISTDEPDEITAKMDYEANILPIMDKPLIGSLIPLISTRNSSIYGERIRVLVERKGQRTSSENTRKKSLPKKRQISFADSKHIDGEVDSYKRTRLKNLSAWSTKQGFRLRRAFGLDGHMKNNPFLLSGQEVPESGSPVILANEFEPSSSNNSETVCQDCQRVILNVSGLKFETWLAVLNNHPTTLLGDADKRMPFYDEQRKEYFFDRHRPSFEAIFNYYQYGGRIKRPAVVADDIFLRELEFFQIEKDALESYKKNEGYVPEVIILPENRIKRKLWLLFEYPETSPLAFCFSVTSVIFTVISIILFCVETLPVYAQTHCEPGAKPNFRDPFFIIETICTIWFTFELIIRFVSCPSHKKFIKDLKNLIDLAAIVPYYITLTNVLITFSCEGAKSSASLAFLRVIRLIRVFKLTKHSSGLQVLVLTFKESIEGLSLFLVAFIVCILVFSSVLYYVEIDRKGSQIESIPDAFWWAVITMCTVGYGDKVPKGPLGKIVGSVCAVAGVLTLAIPVPIITENFNKFYAHKTGRGRR